MSSKPDSGMHDLGSKGQRGNMLLHPCGDPTWHLGVLDKVSASHLLMQANKTKIDSHGMKMYDYWKIIIHIRKTFYTGTAMGNGHLEV